MKKKMSISGFGEVLAERARELKWYREQEALLLGKAVDGHTRIPWGMDIPTEPEPAKDLSYLYLPPKPIELPPATPVDF
jgi:hypothetical protein